MSSITRMIPPSRDIVCFYQEQARPHTELAGRFAFWAAGLSRQQCWPTGSKNELIRVRIFLKELDRFIEEICDCDRFLGHSKGRVAPPSTRISGQVLPLPVWGEPDAGGHV
jgi:hypothetical protein